MEKVVFKNNKGLNLVANIMGRDEKMSRPIVIFAHGLNSSKDSPRNLYIAEGLVEKGFCCFLPDFTGHGESKGDASDATVEQFARDLEASLNYIDSIKGIDPMRIGICGSSMGGTAALVRSSIDGRIMALALRSAPAEGYLQNARQIRIPVLIVQGDADPIMKESLILYEHISGDKKFVLIKGADHLYSREEHIREARNAIVQWFVERLGSESRSGIFRDRRDAGVKLADELKDYKDRKDVLVLALPRGGVITGYEVASFLRCPLDIIIVRKIGFPGEPELAVGAVSETGTVFLNQSIISTYGVSDKYINGEISSQKAEIQRRVDLYRKGKKIPDLKEKVIILVDDGIATGATMKAAISALKAEGIKRLVAAIPVAPPETAEELRQEVDELVCLETPYDFMAVGSYYQDFTQVSDEKVVEILERMVRGDKFLWGTGNN